MALEPVCNDDAPAPAAAARLQYPQVDEPVNVQLGPELPHPDEDGAGVAVQLLGGPAPLVVLLRVRVRYI